MVRKLTTHVAVINQTTRRAFTEGRILTPRIKTKNSLSCTRMMMAMPREGERDVQGGDSVLVGTRAHAAGVV
jgi:hypothetical protein